MVPMMGNKVALNPEIFAKDENYAIAYGMGITAEKVAQQWQVSREDQDAFALESHQRAVAAIASGAFGAEISPLEVTHRTPDLGSPARCGMQRRRCARTKVREPTPRSRRSPS